MQLQLRETSKPVFSKEELSQLLILAQSDRERELIKYATFRASGISKTSASKHFGFQNLSERCTKVEESIQEAERIRQCIGSLSQVQEQTFLQSLGFNVSNNSDSSDEDEATDAVVDEPMEDAGPTDTLFDMSVEELIEILQTSHFNWFEVVSTVLETNDHVQEQNLIDHLENLIPELEDKLDDSEMTLLEQSHQAFHCDEARQKLADHEANALNGLIVTDSESELDPDELLDLHDLAGERVKSLVMKKRKSLQRRARYERAKQIEQRNYLGRKVSGKVTGILKDFPDIGKEIEKFVQDSSVGADAWRRTGILTFDGNTRVKCKVTYERIRQHLIKTYKRNFSFGTVVQLCVARNRRRQSAKRYKDVAKVTSRRARKGFMIKYNPDAHWSSAFYRNLNYIQYTDGRHILNVNRDDAAGFRLDTMATHRLHRTPMVQGAESTTTYTDYVNKYKAVLQTTSYNFSRTETTPEFCAGVVKPVGLFPKNPTQHLSDLEMLENAPEMKPAFINPITGVRKEIECIRVDGASDEGPSHEEVQFMWSARHLSLATLVTARNSGSSYLNRVELQNGCLALAHANLFIPSTLGGSCMDAGKVDKEKYAKNMNLATDVYINRVNECSCGETVINLYRGADSSARQETRVHMLQYLKGSKSQKEALQQNQPTLYAYFEQVWQVRDSVFYSYLCMTSEKQPLNNHMVKDLPPQYAFFLVCCLKQDCSHPVCSKGEVSMLPTWFQSGPSLSCLPLPVADPSRPYGNPNCEDCRGNFCSGHYLKPKDTLSSSSSSIKQPSFILKEAFDKLESYPPSDSVYSDLSKKAMLPVDKVRIWLEHLHTICDNRKKGAIKAAETRRRKSSSASVAMAQESAAMAQESAAMAQESATMAQDTEYQCGVCHAPYQEFTDVEESWIGCDACDTWFHFTCLGITGAPDVFLCSDCQ